MEPVPPPPPYIAWGMKWGVGFIAGSNEMVPLCKPAGAPWLAPAIQWFSEFAVWTWWVTAMADSSICPQTFNGTPVLPWQTLFMGTRVKFQRETLRRSYDT